MTTKTQTYDVPREVWLMVTRARNLFRPSLRTVVGESKTNWLVAAKGGGDPLKFPKVSWEIVSKDEALDLDWSYLHHEEIARAIGDKSPAILRQIAALIGYKEGA